ncbi:hypothetical protein, variant [Aphanomyces astaci]|uniref:Origin recognition complex subunit 3 N-terminal domain-containing protein n=1 Tax=Aphanomyces astaci TaxID=112090 RepID=W4GKX2_APHAT|nr:hypothetical protein, variant [Aphanomyces astaci]ETV80001.1 hypothetical protein, variant [Aphanomyces astaci]|eukprot:XP_009830937.1 hypothetical protein, variant [Aphanomyces astaci]
MMDHVDLSTGMTWHPAGSSSSKKRKQASVATSAASSPSLTNFAFQCAFDTTQAAVNSVLQKANHACFDQVLDSFVERSSSSTNPHLLPLQPFPVAAVIAGTDAGAASSGLWTDPLTRRLKHRFPFVVGVQRQFTNGRQMLEYVASMVFAEAANRVLEGQWLQIEMQRQEKQLTSRRSYRLPPRVRHGADVPVIKWDTVAAILRQVHDIVAPVMHHSDDVTIQAEMLHMELQSAAEASIADCRANFDAACACMDRLLADSTDRIQYLRKLVGPDTATERKLLELHQWLVRQYLSVVEHELKLEAVDTKRSQLRRLLRTIATAHATDQRSGAEDEIGTVPPPLCVPSVLVIVDQYESMDDRMFADFLHMWRDHSTSSLPPLRIGLVLGLSSQFSPAYRRMSPAVASMVSVVPFVLEDSFKSFADICQTLVLASFPVTLSGAVFTYLHSTFTQTHSIQAFLAALKLILYHHATPNPSDPSMASSLDLHRVLALFPLPPDAADAARLPATVRAYVQSLNLSESAALAAEINGGLNAENECVESVVEDAVERVRQRRLLWQCMWTCVDMTWHMCTTFEPEWASLDVAAVALALDGHLMGSIVAQHMQSFFLHHVGVRALHSLVLEWRQCVARYAPYRTYIHVKSST